jgi:hypothetical protein
MLSLGACIVAGEEGDHDNDSVFYVEIKPISDNYVIQALEVCNFSLEELRINGMPPQQAMNKLLIGLQRCQEQENQYSLLIL